MNTLTNFSIYCLILGVLSLNIVLLFIGAVALLIIYFHTTLKEESDRLKRQAAENREFNESLRNSGRLN